MSLLLRRLERAAPVVPPVVPPETITGGGNYNFLNPRRYRISEREKDREELRLEIKRIGEASKPAVITGIVETKRNPRAPNIETLARVAQQRREAEQARQEQLRRQLAADDEWLMLS